MHVNSLFVDTMSYSEQAISPKADRDNQGGTGMLVIYKILLSSLINLIMLLATRKKKKKKV